MDEAAEQYRLVVERATADPNVLGLILSGSRTVDQFVTPLSDFDCYVITQAPDEPNWAYTRGAGVETVAVTAEQFATHALVGTPTFWNRPSFLFARLEFDKADGEVGRLLEAKRRLAPEEADNLIREWLEGYLNSLYRSLKNLRDGCELAGRLDALESISPLLTVAFALEGRVRPFSKWLAYELARAPLPIPAFLERVAALAADTNAIEQRSMFRDVEELAGARGYGELVDQWEPDVAFFRDP